MKKVSLLFILVFALSACQERIEPIDIDAEKATLNEMFAHYEELFINQGVDSILSLCSEDLLICGSDPKEFANKEEYKLMFDAMKGPNYPVISFFGDRVIKVAPDGKSAFVVEQLNASYSPGIPWRQVHYLLKKDDLWLISVSSFSLIPRNEDIPAIIMAVAPE